MDKFFLENKSSPSHCEFRFYLLVQELKIFREVLSGESERKKKRKNERISFFFIMLSTATLFHFLHISTLFEEMTRIKKTVENETMKSSDADAELVENSTNGMFAQSLITDTDRGRSKSVPVIMDSGWKEPQLLICSGRHITFAYANRQRLNGVECLQAGKMRHIGSVKCHAFIFSPFALTLLSQFDCQQKEE